MRNVTLVGLLGLLAGCALENQPLTTQPAAERQGGAGSRAQASPQTRPAAKPKGVRIGFHLAVAEAGPGFTEMRDELSQPMFVAPQPELTEQDILVASTVDDARGRLALLFTLTEDGRQRFAAFSRTHIGSRVAVLIDGELMAAPTIRDEINTGKIEIAGPFARERLADIARKINGE